jgi:type III pantothenate kinase
MVNKAPTLYLDCGNTRIKYSHGGVYGVFADPLALSAFATDGNVSEVVLASVSNQTTAVVSSLNAQGIEVNVASVTDGFAGLFLVYPDVTLLGVDRWLGMLGARERFPDRDVWVIDAGTALKIDYLTKHSRHKGGSISVGLALAAKSLTGNTALLPQADLFFTGQLGQDTAECLNFGIVYGAIALIEQAVRTFGSDEAQVVLTGGDAEVLRPHLSMHVALEPHLVLQGLECYWRLINEFNGESK